MTGFRPLIVGMILISVFIFSLLAFTTNYLTENNPDSAVLNDTSISGGMTRLNSNLNNFSEQTRLAYNETANAQPSATDYLFLIFKGAFSIPKMFLGVAVTTINIIGEFAFGSVLGASTQQAGLIVGAFTSIMVITIIFLIIKFIRSGESER